MGLPLVKYLGLCRIINICYASWCRVGTYLDLLPANNRHFLLQVKWEMAAAGEVGDRCCWWSGRSLLLVKWEITAASEVGDRCHWWSERSLLLVRCLGFRRKINICYASWCRVGTYLDLLPTINRHCLLQVKWEIAAAGEVSTTLLNN